ncbi:MAG: hypothetical protein HRT69_05835 [Flavobacteriaceae bacterium]|nr:hypothetical protein [Flavobacteriaceae bacterium]
MYVYILAESVEVNLLQQSNKVLISGVGTRILDNPALENRAKRKTITQKMILSLIDVAKKQRRYRKDSVLLEFRSLSK